MAKQVKWTQNIVREFSEKAMLSEDELRHALVVHEYIVSKIDELKRVYNAPVEMQEIWDKKHTKYIEKVAWLKQMLTM